MVTLKDFIHRLRSYNHLVQYHRKALLTNSCLRETFSKSPIVYVFELQQQQKKHLIWSHRLFFIFYTAPFRVEISRNVANLRLVSAFCQLFFSQNNLFWCNIIVTCPISVRFRSFVGIFSFETTTAPSNFSLVF